MRASALNQGKSVSGVPVLFLLVIVLGLESLRSLNYVNDASAQIRVRWLPSTRALGDLNNLTTDFPAAETAMLRASSVSERATTEQQMADLDRGIAAAQLAYRQIRHDATEDDLYRRFESRWSEYRSIVARSHRCRPGPPARRGIRVENQVEIGLRRRERSARECSRSAISQAPVKRARRSDLVYAQARKRIVLAIFLAALLVAGAMLHVTRSISCAARRSCRTHAPACRE